jgi:seryl-tRNA synthetase
MPNRVQKASKPASVAALERKVRLYETITSNPVVMPSCSSCQSRGISSCQTSVQDSSRCAECVRLNLTRCDVLGPSLSQLRHLSSQHQKLEGELEAAEAIHRDMGLKVERLRKQKRMWFEKMMRAVARGIDSVEELERVEREELEREAAQRPEASSSSVPIGRSSSAGFVSAEFEQEWAEQFGSVPLDPALMEDFDVAALSYDTVSADAERPSGS